MRKFSIRPTLTLRGRTFKGLRGWSGKPTHPPLTDLPVAAYILGATFDVIAVVGRNQAWSRDFFRAGTFLFIGGAAVSVLTALTGFWDWLRSTEKGTQARRTANRHAWTMIFVTALALVDIALRLNGYHTRTHPTVPILVISIMVAALVAVGATFGGSLVFEHGFNVETAGDSPVWHVSETDVMPGDPVPVDDEMSPADRLADSEVAVTSRTPDPLASSSSDEGSADG
ncbi:MAG TPA: DUF2231 domain-containing protein [Ilumatobacteraceae bacterium]|nr:DUF2231 domain-containing protein [Ilumatobacteraceae bacterium]